MFGFEFLVNFGEVKKDVAIRDSNRLRESRHQTRDLDTKQGFRGTEQHVVTVPELCCSTFFSFTKIDPKLETKQDISTPNKSFPEFYPKLKIIL